MSERTAVSESVFTPIHRSHPPPIGTWTIDPADSGVALSLSWRKLRLRTIIGRLQCLGVVHLDDLPSVGVIRFQQPSGMPVLTMALDPASVETDDADLNTLLRSPDVDALRRRWWTLRSESLEVLAGGTLRVMATLTAQGTEGLVELRLKINAGASSRGLLVVEGRGVLNRHAFGIDRRASIFEPKVLLDLAFRARRVAGGIGTQANSVTDGCPACRPARVRSKSSAERGASVGQARPSAGSGTLQTVVAAITMTGQLARPGADRDAA
jgi:polyisoprenoid-binding protein YceI